MSDIKSSPVQSLPVATAIPNFDPSNPMSFAMNKIQNLKPEELAQAKKVATQAAQAGSGAMKSAMKQATNMKVNASDTLFRWTGGLLGTKKVVVDPYKYHKIGGGIALLFIIWYFMLLYKKTGAPGDEDQNRKDSQLYIWLRNTFLSYLNFVKSLANDLDKLTNGNLSLILLSLLLALIYYHFFYNKAMSVSRPLPVGTSYKSYYAPRRCRYKMK